MIANAPAPPRPSGIFYAIFGRRKGMYLWTCWSFKSANYKKWICKSQIHKVSHLRKVPQILQIIPYTAGLRFTEVICGFCAKKFGKFDNIAHELSFVIHFQLKKKLIIALRYIIGKYNPINTCNLFGDLQKIARLLYLKNSSLASFSWFGTCWPSRPVPQVILQELPPAFPWA